MKNAIKNARNITATMRILFEKFILIKVSFLLRKNLGIKNPVFL